jgi:heterodisulfide reductase subunit C
MATDSTQARAPTFMEKVMAATPGVTNLERCIQCGTCGGSCPSGPDMDHTPRAIFALMAAGKEDKVLSSNTPWYCVSCYFCMVRCPQEIHITDIMYTLKRFSLHEGTYKKGSAADAPGFSQNFIYFVENYGRSFELGVASRYHLETHPLEALKLAPFGLGMWRRGRMDFTPKKIKHLDQLKAILNKAKELEEADWAELEA